MGIDREGISGEENSEMFEDRFPGTDCPSGGSSRRLDAAPGITIPNKNKPLSQMTHAEKCLIGRYGGAVSFGKRILDLIVKLRSVSVTDSLDFWDDLDGSAHPLFGYLFHANSVITSVSFIRNGFLFSRAYGDKLNGNQTTQKSDDLDKKLGIYNDIFFDFSDMCGRNKYSVYGPVMFVFDPAVLEKSLVRMTKINPGSSRYADSTDTLTFSNLFFTSWNELQEEYDSDPGKFKLSYNHHVTAFDQEKLPIGDHLIAIYIEKCYDRSGKENDLKALLEAELQKAGLEVPVIIRNKDAVAEEDYKIPTAAPLTELWRFPEDT